MYKIYLGNISTYAIAYLLSVLYTFDIQKDYLVFLKTEGGAMVKQKEEVLLERKPSPFDGLGEITVRSLLDGEEMYNKGRVFAHTTVHPGAEIGYHVHNNESETYYILSGKGKFNDNGVVRTVTSGNVTFTGAGQGHGIANDGDIPLEMIALILYQ